MLWDDKPYHSLNWELKKRFGRKIYKLALSGAVTCPNRDGTLGHGGCIFCSEGGSGDFAGLYKSAGDGGPANIDGSAHAVSKGGQANFDKSAHAASGYGCLPPVSAQIAAQKALLSAKMSSRKSGDEPMFIAYFQAYTETYGPIEHLREIFTEAIMDPTVCVLSIATRPDCLPPEVLDLLEELNRIKPVWVELGLQTIHESTAEFIRRGYRLPVFEEAVLGLRARGIEVIVHTILGLPGEDKAMVLETMRYLNTQDIQGVKLQLLHVLKGTDLANLYLDGTFSVLSMVEYIQMVIECLETLSPDLVIHRVTGDGPKDLLIAPTWSGAKRTVLNTLHHDMKLSGAYQGRLYER